MAPIASEFSDRSGGAAACPGPSRCFLGSVTSESRRPLSSACYDCYTKIPEPQGGGGRSSVPHARRAEKGTVTRRLGTRRTAGEGWDRGAWCTFSCPGPLPASLPLGPGAQEHAPKVTSVTHEEGRAWRQIS